MTQPTNKQCLDCQSDDVVQIVNIFNLEANTDTLEIYQCKKCKTIYAN